MVGGELDFVDGLGSHKTLKETNLEITPDRNERFRQCHEERNHNISR
jgi:hypothetical protein